MATFMNESIIIGSDRGTPRGPWPGIALLVALVALAVGSWLFLGESAEGPADDFPLATTTDVVAPAPVVATVKLAFLDGSGDGAGKPIGCDSLELVALAVPPTADPVSVALESLFGAATSTDLTPGNFVAGQDGLAFDRAESHEDDVHVYLTGEVTYAGVCDDPRLQFQIEETVRANRPAVDEVEIFLNDEPYEMPNEKGEEEEA